MPLYNASMNNFASRLYQARTARDWSTDTLSKKSGVPVEVIDNLEQRGRGRTGRNAGEKFPNLAKALGVDPEWLATGKQKDIPLNASKASSVHPSNPVNSDTFAFRLYQARTELGWSQAELGAKIGGKSQGFIQKLESDPSRTTTSSKKIAEQLGVSHAWLTKGEGSKKPLPIKNHQRLVDAIQTLPESLAEKLADVFEELGKLGGSGQLRRKNTKKPIEKTFAPAPSSENKKRSRISKKAA